jgi:cell division protein FtsL
MPSREELELRKLELEVADFSRPAWLRASYLAALLPTVIAVLGFLAALLSGFFSDERRQLRQQTTQLQAERDSLSKEKDRLGVERDKERQDKMEERRQWNAIANELLSRVRKQQDKPPTIPLTEGSPHKQ